MVVAPANDSAARSPGTLPHMSGFDILVLGDANPDLVLSGDDGRAGLRTGGAAGRRGATGHRRLRGHLRVRRSQARSARRVRRCRRRRHVRPVHVRPTAGARRRHIGVAVLPDRATGVTVVLSGRRRPRDADVPRHDRRSAPLGRSTRTCWAGRSHIHVSSYFLQRALAPELPDAVPRGARQGEATTSLDPNWDPSGIWDNGLMALLPEVDVFLPNEVEALSLARISVVEEAIARLRSSGAGTVVVKTAAQGAVGAQAGDLDRRPARSPRRSWTPPAPATRSTRGSSRRSSDGESLRRCLEIGNACGCALDAGGSAARRRSRPWSRRWRRSSGAPSRDRLSGREPVDRQALRGRTAGARGYPPPDRVRADGRRQGAERGARGGRVWAATCAPWRSSAGTRASGSRRRSRPRASTGSFVWTHGENRSSLSVADRETGGLTEFYEHGSEVPSSAWPELARRDRRPLRRRDVAHDLRIRSRPGIDDSAYRDLVAEARASRSSRGAGRGRGPAAPGAGGATRRGQGELVGGVGAVGRADRASRRGDGRGAEAARARGWRRSRGDRDARRGRRGASPRPTARSTKASCTCAAAIPSAAATRSSPDWSWRWIAGAGWGEALRLALGAATANAELPGRRPPGPVPRRSARRPGDGPAHLMAVEIRRVGAGEWRELRDLRLRALQDAPDAFTAIYEEESTLPDTHWTGWATELAEGGSSFGLVAEQRGAMDRHGGRGTASRPPGRGRSVRDVGRPVRARRRRRSRPRRGCGGVGGSAGFPRHPAPGHRLERGGGATLRAVRVLRCRSARAAARGLRRDDDVDDDGPQNVSITLK